MSRAGRDEIRTRRGPADPRRRCVTDGEEEYGLLNYKFEFVVRIRRTTGAAVRLMRVEAVDLRSN